MIKNIKNKISRGLGKSFHIDIGVSTVREVKMNIHNLIDHKIYQVSRNMISNIHDLIEDNCKFNIPKI